MLVENNKKNLKNYYIFISLVLLVCVLGAVFGVTYAYLSGVFKKDDGGTTNPFVEPVLVYNGNVISENSIVGAVSDAGDVTMTINGTSVGLNALNIGVQNNGNINAKVYEIYYWFEYFEADGTTPFDYAAYGDSYFTLNVSSPYSLDEFGFYVIGTASLTKDAGNTSVILNGITVDQSIVGSGLCGKKFVLHFFVGIGQEGLDVSSSEVQV